MASGIFSWLGEALLSGATAQDLGAANPEGASTELVAFLYNAANAPSSGNLEDETVKTLANLNTATSGSLEDASHAADVGTRTVGAGSNPYALDAPDTVITSAAAGGSNAKDVALAVRAGGSLSTRTT